MRIIVEGPDGAGKSHLVGYLNDLFTDRLEMIKPIGKRDDLLDVWNTMMSPSFSFAIPLHDRFVYSELVYGPVIRGELSVSEADISGIIRGLRREALLIYARPDRATLELGVRAESQMEGVTDKFTELVEAYDQLMAVEQKYYGLRFYKFNWLSIVEPRQVVEHLQRYLRGELE